LHLAEGWDLAAIENHVIRRGVQMNMAHPANAVQKRNQVGEVDVLIEVHVLEGKEIRESLLDTPAHSFTATDLGRAMIVNEINQTLDFRKPLFVELCEMLQGGDLQRSMSRSRVDTQ